MNPYQKDKARCKNWRCNWKGLEQEILLAPNPFDASDQLQGCPKCKDINTMLVCCYEAECWEFVDGGEPTPAGYKQACGDHLSRIVKGGEAK